jgi:hypothetical protein
LRTGGEVRVPLLDFPIEEPIDAIVLGPNPVVPVKVPAPERFVLHKLISSQERKTDRAAGHLQASHPSGERPILG